MTINQTAEALRPCPFCGSEDVFVERADFADCYVICNNCSARGPVSCDETEADAEASESGAVEPGELPARRLWSKRAETPAPPSTASSEGASVTEDEMEQAARFFVRRVFDHFGKGRSGHVSMWEHVYKSFRDELGPIAREAVRAALTHPHPSGGVEGWLLVPVEPTEEMVDAVLEGTWLGEEPIADLDFFMVADLWRAMISVHATPTDPSGEVERVAREDQAQLLGDRIEQQFGCAVPASWADAMVGELAALRPQDVQASGQSLASKGASNG